MTTGNRGSRNGYYERKLRMQRRQRRIRRLIIGCIVVICLVTIGAALMIFRPEVVQSALNQIIPHKQIDLQMEGIEITQDFLTVNPYSRPGDKLKRVKNVVIHYTANPGSTARGNRSYFENLQYTEETYASAHFVIGLEGEIIQCIPLDEICYAANERNVDSISIECCHPDETGEFTKATYESLIELTAWLCGEYNLKMDHVIRHYDVKGKACPLYYVENEDKWEQLKEDVAAYLEEHGQ